MQEPFPAGGLVFRVWPGMRRKSVAFRRFSSKITATNRLGIGLNVVFLQEFPNQVENKRKMKKTDIFDQFERRHIGPDSEELTEMLASIGVESLDQLIEETVPSAIRLKRPLHLPSPLSEYEYLQELRAIAAHHQVFKSYIGMGYNGTITPSDIA